MAGTGGGLGALFAGAKFTFYVSNYSVVFFIFWISAKNALGFMGGGFGLSSVFFI